ncbi:hypothetical protein GCM10022247_18900 [Allokutzneria multivorans]|uniref:SH3 domain-containing protein n=1 Tax=Allokutzneria multivorans TaxID=1142134 RepID=A0ABP7RKL1_9PSEU
MSISTTRAALITAAALLAFAAPAIASPTAEAAPAAAAAKDCTKNPKYSSTATATDTVLVRRTPKSNDALTQFEKGDEVKVVFGHSDSGYCYSYAKGKSRKGCDNKTGFWYRTVLARVNGSTVVGYVHENCLRF